MKFHIHEVTPDSVVGWVVPDNPLESGRVLVRLDGHEGAVVEATGILPDIRDRGWHGTGCCLFHVNDDTVPGFSAAQRYELYDADTNVLVYRGPRREAIAEAKLLLMEPGLKLQGSLRYALFPHFQVAYFDIENLPAETLEFALHTYLTKSLLFAGRILVARYDSALFEQGFTTSILIADPYEELAAKLVWLRERAPLGGGPGQAWRIGSIEGPVAFATGLVPDNPAALKRAFRLIDNASFVHLSNPVVRQLCCNFAEELPRASHANAALESLARFSVVGHHAFWDGYVAMVGEALGRPLGPLPRVPVSPEVEALAAQLRPIDAVRELIEFDLTLSEAVREIVERHWSS